jgi:HTH-type transcriptional regulator/antitoxin HigA
VKAATERISGFGALLPAWKGLRKSVPHFGPIRNERHYKSMNALMEHLLEEVGEDEDHQLADLLDIVSTLVEDYEARNSPLADARPRDALKFLMERHGLKQSDLKKEIGSQGVVSEILAGDREINVRQARALAKRFSVSPAVFV